MEVGAWVDMWFNCVNIEPMDNGKKVVGVPKRHCWPDGKSYLEQDNMVVEMFNIIADEYREYQRRGY